MSERNPNARQPPSSFHLPLQFVNLSTPPEPFFLMEQLASPSELFMQSQQQFALSSSDANSMSLQELLISPRDLIMTPRDENQNITHTPMPLSITGQGSELLQDMFSNECGADSSVQRQMFSSGKKFAETSENAFQVLSPSTQTQDRESNLQRYNSSTRESIGTIDLQTCTYNAQPIISMYIVLSLPPSANAETVKNVSIRPYVIEKYWNPFANEKESPAHVNQLLNFEKDDAAGHQGRGGQWMSQAPKTHETLEEFKGADDRLTKEFGTHMWVSDVWVPSLGLVLFEVFLSIADCQVLKSLTNWETLEAVLYVQFREKRQTIYPLTHNISRSMFDLSPQQGLFLGSFSFDGENVNHYEPSEMQLKQKYKAVDAAARKARREEEGILEPLERYMNFPSGDDQLVEASSHGGRPIDGQGNRLMTRHQVAMFLRIRERFEGLTTRQRRKNVKRSDFFPFLTLGRDETAKYMGTCTTWLKTVVRKLGIRTWPSRPLLSTAVRLRELKKELNIEQAMLQTLSPTTDSVSAFQANERMSRLENGIEELRHARLRELQLHVTSEFFLEFCQKAPANVLDPDWDVSPPTTDRVLT